MVPAGDNAVLIELGEVSASELHARARAMREEAGVIAVIPGHSSLYVVRWSVGLRPAPPPEGRPEARTPRRTHHIRVNFDGPDRPPGFVPREFVLTVRYLGFRGGFGYLDGWPEEYAMPRKTTSRPVSRGCRA